MSPFYCQRYFKSDLKVCKCLVHTESNRDSIMQPPPATSDEDIILLALQIQLDCHYSQKILQFGKYEAFGLKHLDSKCPYSLQLYFQSTSKLMPFLSLRSSNSRDSKIQFQTLGPEPISNIMAFHFSNSLLQIYGSICA